MSAFNAFARFGHVSFSSRELPGERIYEALKRAMGPAFDDSFDGSHTQAKLYAWAMGLASASMMLDRVKNNAIAKKATDLLPNLERQYGIIPYQGESKIQRRARLHARQQVARGASYEAIWEIMNSLLGDQFEAWTVATAATLIRFPDTSSDAADQANFVPAGTQARVLRSSSWFFSGTQTVPVEELTTPSGITTVQAMVGRGILVDPAVHARRERVEIEDVVTDASGKITSVTATFGSVHDAGTHFTTQHFPLWRSTTQHHFFQLALAAATDSEKRRLVNDELARSMKSVATWDMGVTGGFAPDEGLVGVTAIGNDASDPSAPIKDILGDDVVAYWGAHPTDFKQDTSGNANHLALVGSEPAAFSIDGSMGGVVLTDSTELSCDALASIASGTDNPFAVAFWGQWVSSGLAVWAFEKSDDDARHEWQMLSSMTGSLLGVSRTDDDANAVSDNTGVDATGDERFFCHSFTAGGSAANILQVDATVQNPALNVNPTTVDRFRLAGLGTGTFRVARIVVVSSAITEQQAADLRAHWVAQSAWNA